MTKEKTPVYILSLETSGFTSAVALSLEDRLLGQISLNIKNIHSRRLALLSRQLLEHAGVHYPDLSAIAISAGPGSFTGLRIGYSLAKGLAHSLDIPILEVPTLDIWAYQQGATTLPVISAIDAHRGELFVARYHWEANEMIKDGQEELVKMEQLNEVTNGTVLFVGGALEKLQDEIRAAAGENAVFPFPRRIEPENRAIIQLAYKKFLRREFSAVENCEPGYLRSFKGVM